jgi:rSAM/selenodomain-associated transferase 1
VADTLDVVRVAGFPLTLFYTPAGARDEARSLLRGGEGLAPQPEGDLGVRMSAAIHHLIEEGAGQVVVVGSDLPSLPAAHLHDAFAALDAVDVVVGPAADGGYYLIGMTRLWPALFDRIAWGTAAVLERTLHAAASHQLRMATVPGWYDVDDAADLARVTQSGEPALRTRAWIERHGANERSERRGFST